MTDSGTTLSTTSSSQASPTTMFVPLLDGASLPPFNPKEDPHTLAVRWKLWKRSFNLYLVAKGITKDEQKTARNVMQATRLDILQSVAKQRNANLLQEMTREGIIHGVEPINYQRIQPLANKIIMHLQLESVSLQVVMKLI